MVGKRSPSCKKWTDHAPYPLPPSLQFLYANLVGSFPFNAFLAGFFCCLSAFVLTGEQQLLLLFSLLFRCVGQAAWELWKRTLLAEGSKSA